MAVASSNALKDEFPTMSIYSKYSLKVLFSSGLCMKVEILMVIVNRQQAESVLTPSTASCGCTAFCSSGASAAGDTVLDYK